MSALVTKIILQECVMKWNRRGYPPQQGGAVADFGSSQRSAIPGGRGSCRAVRFSSSGSAGASPSQVNNHPRLHPAISLMRCTLRCQSQAAIVKQRGQSSVTDRPGVSSAMGWLPGLVSAERDGYLLSLSGVTSVVFQTPRSKRFQKSSADISSSIEV